MLASTKELTDENDQMRERDRDLRLAVELHEKEKKMALNKSDMQSKVGPIVSFPGNFFMKYLSKYFDFFDLFCFLAYRPSFNGTCKVDQTCEGTDPLSKSC